MAIELIRGQGGVVERERLREMGFPVSDDDEKYEPQLGVYRVEGGSVTVILIDDDSLTAE
jgi:hypothetical protein